MGLKTIPFTSLLDQFDANYFSVATSFQDAQNQQLADGCDGFIRLSRSSIVF